MERNGGKTRFWEWNRKSDRKDCFNFCPRWVRRLRGCNRVNFYFWDWRTMGSAGDAGVPCIRLLWWRRGIKTHFAIVLSSNVLTSFSFFFLHFQSEKEVTNSASGAPGLLIRGEEDPGLAGPWGSISGWNGRAGQASVFQPNIWSPCIWLVESVYSKSEGLLDLGEYFLGRFGFASPMIWARAGCPADMLLFDLSYC